MKKLPAVTTKEVQTTVIKSATVQLRVTPSDKTEIQRAATRANLTVTDYLVACHKAVAAKLPKKK